MQDLFKEWSVHIILNAIRSGGGGGALSPLCVGDFSLKIILHCVAKTILIGGQGLAIREVSKLTPDFHNFWRLQHYVGISNS